MKKELSYYYREFLLRILRLVLQWRTRLTNRRFFCRSLAGMADGGIFVNSDMTVSCNCQDFDGSGQLGSLRKQTFEDIFAGEIASRFRRKLAGGRLPLTRCGACFYLRTVKAMEADELAREFHIPRGLGVENTVRCNLRCRSCCRQAVMEVRKPGLTLSLDDVEVVAKSLQRMKARRCAYYNLGEPFFSKSILRELEILKAYNPNMEIITSTNGILLDTDEKRQAVLLLNDLVFSIDGISTEMVNRYQRGGNFEKAYKNLKDLVAFRNGKRQQSPRIGWKYVVFRWNDSPKYIRKAIELAKQAGIDYLQLTFARNPVQAISWRMLCSPFYKSLGVKKPWRNRSTNIEFTYPSCDAEKHRPGDAGDESVGRAA